MMFSGTDAVRAVSSDFRGICLHTADVDSGPLGVWEEETWQAERKVSAITSPIIQQKCLSETMPGSLETLPLAPPHSCNSSQHDPHPLSLPQKQKPPETDLPPKQLLLVCTAALLNGNAVIQLPQERNNLRPVQSFRHGLTKWTDLHPVGMLGWVPALGPLHCSWPRAKTASLQCCSLNCSSLSSLFESLAYLFCSLTKLKGKINASEGKGSANVPPALATHVLTDYVITHRGVKAPFCGFSEHRGRIILP